MPSRCSRFFAPIRALVDALCGLRVDPVEVDSRGQTEITSSRGLGAPTALDVPFGRRPPPATAGHSDDDGLTLRDR